MKWDTLELSMSDREFEAWPHVHWGMATIYFKDWPYGENWTFVLLLLQTSDFEGVGTNIYIFNEDRNENPHKIWNTWHMKHFPGRGVKICHSVVALLFLGKQNMNLIFDETWEDHDEISGMVNMTHWLYCHISKFHIIIWHLLFKSVRNIDYMTHPIYYETKGIGLPGNWFRLYATSLGEHKNLMIMI